MVALNDISKSYSVRPLNEGETLNSFNCGDEELNEFILSKASEYKKNTSCSVVCIGRKWKSHRLFCPI